MNQIDEQKGLIEYLEAALTGARKHLALDPEKIAELSANSWRHEPSLSGSLKSPRYYTDNPQRAQSRNPRPAADQRDFELNLQLHTEPFYRLISNNLKSLFVNETKVYNISARPIQTNLMIEVAPWYRMPSLKSSASCTSASTKSWFWSGPVAAPISTRPMFARGANPFESTSSLVKLPGAPELER